MLYSNKSYVDMNTGRFFKEKYYPFGWFKEKTEFNVKNKDMKCLGESTVALLLYKWIFVNDGPLLPCYYCFYTYYYFLKIVYFLHNYMSADRYNVMVRRY